jgi:thiol-disulfide isomerase/thioredoxin
MMKLSLGIALVALAAVGVAKGPEASVGKKLPAISLTGVDGKAINNKSLAGKVVILDFWATWCGPCKKASPTMDALQKKYGSKLVVVGASYDDPVGAVKKYQAEHKYGYTFATGGKAAADKLGVVNIPAIFIIDAKGVVKYVATGWDDKSPATFEAALKKAM